MNECKNEISSMKGLFIFDDMDFLLSCSDLLPSCSDLKDWETDNYKSVLHYTKKKTAIQRLFNKVVSIFTGVRQKKQQLIELF